MSANPIYLPRSGREADDQLSPAAALVRATLVERGLETPMVENGLSADQK